MPNQEDFEIAFAIARKDFGRRDPSLQAEKAGVAWTADSAGEGGHAEVPFLATPYVIRGPSVMSRTRRIRARTLPSGRRFWCCTISAHLTGAPWPRST